MDLRNPPRWRRPWADHYARALERVLAAERLGLDAVWLTEHHSFEDGYLPQPLTVGAAIAAVTKKIRIGTAILQAPLRPAIEIAEEAALVDILSGGRVELGLGAGYRIPEWEAFGTDGKRRYELLETRARELGELWDEGVATPPPLQRPLPLWIGAEGPRGARIAGRLGTGLLALVPELLPVYRDALRDAGHDPVDARMGGCVNLILADDPEAAWATIRPHLDYQWNSYTRYGAEGTGVAPQAIDPARLRTAGRPMLPRFDVVSPEEAERRIREWVEPLPVRHLYFWDSIAGMPDELAWRHTELLVTRLAPRLHDLGTWASDDRA